MSTKKKSTAKLRPSQRLKNVSDELPKNSEVEALKQESPSPDEFFNPSTAADFSKVIQESTAAIAEADAPKNKGGRPKGSKNKPKDGSTPGTPPPVGAMPVNTPVIPVGILAPVIQMPYTAAALKTGWDGWKLEDEYAQELAPQVDMVLKAYLPQLSEKGAALVGCLFSITTITAIKYMGYLEWKAGKTLNQGETRIPEIKKPEVKQEYDNSAEFPVMKV